ncbi:hypothetical protein GCM10009821_03420 [Aeromicrobium halocynthiae]|uniref:Uncharacterized protein n=1 Tax=Aeromicrobium halocynthiae TaxID=560557 RepID=A0ABN2VT56_9ACTN
MPADMVVLVATAVLACVAVVAALVALRAARQVARHQHADAPSPAEPATPAAVAVRDPEPQQAPREVRVVEGRVIVPPSREEVVSTALSRPQVRLAVLLHGVARALRPESRDRIGALVRREYRDRRRHRLRSGRRAARAAHLAVDPTPPSAHWLGEADGRAEDRAIGA